jgi:hypothetical protein
MRLRSSRFGLALPFILIAAASTTARAQTDVSLSLFGSFNSGTTTGSGTTFLIDDKPANAAGGLFEFRQIRSPLIGYEATYSFNRANQVYSYHGTVPAGSCPSSGCGPLSEAVSANAHQFAGDWVFSARVARLRPFALAGAGLQLTEPTSGQSGTQSATSAVYIYGVGFDWRLRPYLGLRFQCRGSVYKVPGISTSYLFTGPYRNSAEPTIGAYFKF